MKKILFLTPFYSPNLGGVETHLDDLTAYLRGKGYAVTVITYQPLTTGKARAPFVAREKGGTFYRIPWLSGNFFYLFESIPLLQFLYLFPGIFIFGFFYLLFNRSKVSVVHGHGLAATVATVLLSKVFRKKSVVSLHTIYKFRQRPMLARITRQFLRTIPAVMVLAKGCKEDLVDIGIPENKIHVYSCWVDNKNVFVPADTAQARKKLGLDPKRFIALFVGRLSPEKGISVVLDAAQACPDPRILFLVVGGGPLSGQVAAAEAKSQCLRSVNGVSNRSLADYYNAADLLVFGSVDQDYYGRVTMEALSCGLPVILPSKTRYFSSEKKVTVPFPEDQIGKMIEPDSSTLLRTVQEFAGSPALCRSMRERAGEYAKEHFSEKNAEIFRIVYES